MADKKQQAYAGLVLITEDTYIAGRSVKKGRVEKVSAGEFALLDEAHRCEKFDPDNEDHAKALEATQKENAARARAAEEAEKRKAA